VRRPAALGRGQRRPAVVSFQDFAEQHIASHAPGWRAGGKSESQWRSSLAAYVYPVIGGMAVGAVDLNDVLRVLTPIWTAKAVTAGRVRGRVESILDAAHSRGLRTGENPARWYGHLENLLPQVTKTRSVKHYAAIPYAGVPALMGELRPSARGSMPTRSGGHAKNKFGSVLTHPVVENSGGTCHFSTLRLKKAGRVTHVTRLPVIGLHACARTRVWGVSGRRVTCAQCANAQRGAGGSTRCVD
jgi:hypothetical protein